MNIFAIDKDPIQSAMWMVDKHVVKMILETAQLLSTAHRILDGKEFIELKNNRRVKRWRLPDEREHIYTLPHISIILRPCGVVRTITTTTGCIATS